MIIFLAHAVFSINVTCVGSDMGGDRWSRCLGGGIGQLGQEVVCWI